MSQPTVTRYVIVGTGSRANMYFKAMTGTYADRTALVGLCDTSPARMAFYNAKLAALGRPAIPTFAAEQFVEMLRTLKPHRVIVTTVDCHHDHYIKLAMQEGCDVVCEKPMTIDATRCLGILDAVKATGRQIVITFNYRYAPKRAKVKELLDSGVIGDILHVDYEWLLDTTHGADYFRRWHRQKQNSGGLMVHKSTHHFDLVNWWLRGNPVEVFARGNLSFYGAKAGNGPKGHGERCHGCPTPCPFKLDLEECDTLRKLYLEAEPDNGYMRDRCVFNPDIEIEDNVSVAVRYDTGATMSYALVACSPYEGSRIAFTGSKGRLEFTDLEASYISGHDGKYERATTEENATIRVFPQFGAAYDVAFERAEGGHGGGDVRLLADVFAGGTTPDPLGRAANHTDGAKSILTGIAANQSMATGAPVKIDGLLKAGL